MITTASFTHFTTRVKESGEELENRVIKYLDAGYIPYKYNKNKGIDFIVNGDIHMDCVGQRLSGSIGDKLPTKCFKYIKKYNLKDIYILHPNSPITRHVGEHLELLEKTFDCRIHVIDWNDFTYLMSGSLFTIRKPYNFVKGTKPVGNLKVTTASVNKFFKF